jgi:ubiquinone biosynthesis protein
MTRLLPRLLRFLSINIIVLRYSLDQIILSGYNHPLLYLSYLNPWYWLYGRKVSRGLRIRQALIHLGPIFVKIGQLLSNRIDLLPKDILGELAQLQDKVPPFSGRIAMNIIANSLKINLNTVFASIEETALASASIAQVHAASLHDGSKVVLKVLRPKVKQQIRRDLELLRMFAGLASYCLPKIRAFKPLEIVKEIAHNLYAELDLMLEGANAAQLRRNFNNSPDLYIPKIYWSYSNAKVLVMERLDGIPINDTQRLQQTGVDFTKIAELAINIFFTQVFRDNFFHADLHPGNIFVKVTNHAKPQYQLVDFGIVSSLSNHDQRYLAANMLALLKRDYRRVTELHIAATWLPANTRIDLFEAAIRAVCEPAFALPLQELSLAQLLLRLFQTAHKFHVNIQPQLILLQKSLLNIESLSRNLDPNIELLATATPYIEKWLSKQLGLTAYLRTFNHSLPLLTETLPEIPKLLINLLRAPAAHTTSQQAKPTIARKLSYIIKGIGIGLLSASSLLWCYYHSSIHLPALSWVLSGSGLLLLILTSLV